MLVWDLGIFTKAFVCLCIPRWLDNLPERLSDLTSPQFQKTSKTGETVLREVKEKPHLDTLVLRSMEDHV